MSFRNFAGVAAIVVAAALSGCATGSGVGAASPPAEGYRQAMRDFIESISAYARAINPHFAVVAQNGQELLTSDGTPDGTPELAYVSALSGVGREELFYGYTRDNVATPSEVTAAMVPFMNLAQNDGLTVLVIDYCSSKSFVDDSYGRNRAHGYLSFAADRRDLDDIPAYPGTPAQVNSSDVTSLSKAKNFLYLINPQQYPTKSDFLGALRATNYDVLILDLFYHDAALTPSDVASLKKKANGGSRLVIAYLSIGEAESYRYYWNASWKTNPPAWLGAENPDWPGNYKVRYWNKDWQAIISGSDSSYLGKILGAGFDGAYLDLVDAFQYFEGS